MAGRLAPPIESLLESGEWQSCGLATTPPTAAHWRAALVAGAVGSAGAPEPHAGVGNRVAAAAVEEAALLGAERRAGLRAGQLSLCGALLGAGGAASSGRPAEGAAPGREIEP